MRAGNFHSESPGQYLDKDPYQRYQTGRPNARAKGEKSTDCSRPITHESSPEAKIKEDALSTLSVLYNKTKVKKYGSFF